MLSSARASLFEHVHLRVSTCRRMRVHAFRACVPGLVGICVCVGVGVGVSRDDGPPTLSAKPAGAEPRAIEYIYIYI